MLLDRAVGVGEWNFGIFGAMPIRKSCKRVVRRRSAGEARQHRATVFDDIGKLIARAEAKSRPNRLRNGRLRLAGKPAGYHGAERKEFPFGVKASPLGNEGHSAAERARVTADRTRLLARRREHGRR